MLSVVREDFRRILLIEPQIAKTKKKKIEKKTLHSQAQRKTCPVMCPQLAKQGKRCFLWAPADPLT